MKTKIFYTLLFSFISCVYFSKANAQILDETFSLEDIEYTTIEVGSPNKVSITGYTGTNASIIIPATVTEAGITYNITEVGEYAFYNNALTNLVIGDNVTKIGEYAFSSNALTNLIIGDNVIEIGRTAFESNQINNITIGNSVASIGAGAFARNSLISLTIPASVTDLGSQAFAYNTDLNEVILEADTPIEFDSRTFTIDGGTDNSAIDLIVPTGTEQSYIDAQWTGFNTVNSVILSFSIDNIQYDILDLTSPNEVTASAYRGTDTAINIPSSVTNLDTVYDVTTIGRYAFGFDNSLESVTISDGITEIEEYAFRNSYSLASVIIGNSVETIGLAAFGNTSISTITIPASVSSIGESIFYNITELTEVISKSTTPATLPSSVFDDITNVDLIIPGGTEAAYDAADWIDFNSITEDATLSVNNIDISNELTMIVTNENLKLTTINTVNEIQIYALTGAKVALSSSSEIAIDHLSNGMYIAYLQTNTGTATKKFIKK